jgi:hypothetical protein
MADMERYRGDTYADRLVITDATGAPVNITGYTFKLTLDTRTSPSDASTQVYQLVGVITDAVNGVVEFTPNDTQANLVGFYYFDVQMVDGQNRKRTIKRGRYIYTQDITK